MHRPPFVDAPPALSAADRRRFESFAREHETVLFAVAKRLCGNSSDAQDLLQETFERGWKSFHRFQPGTNGRAWLMAILHNRFLDRCRRKVREPLGSARSESIEGHAERLTSSGSEEEAPAWAAVSTDQVLEAMGSLKEDFRITYQLHAVEGRSYAEIAETLRIPKMTVGTRLNRARRRLRELLMPRREEDVE